MKISNITSLPHAARTARHGRVYTRNSIVFETPPIRTLLCALALAWVLPATAGAGSDPPAAMAPDPPGYVAPSRTFSTLHTALDLDIDLEGRRIAGSVTHTIRSLRDGLSEIRFNCVELDVDSVRLNGRPASYDYPVTADRITAWIQDVATSKANDEIVIRCDPPLARGEEARVMIRYHGAPHIGLYWIRPEKGIPEKRLEVWSQGEGEDNRYWFPCHDYPDDRATYEGRFRVPKGFTAISNGELVEKRDVGAQTEFYWKLDQTQVSYLIMLAVAEYRIYEQEWRGIPLWYVVPPGTGDETILREYGLTGEMMEFFTRKIGVDYPYAKYAQVVVQNFIYGGMENTSATTMNMRTLHDERAGLVRSEQNLIAHELAHQWWGDMITCREWSHMWLNEGMATYYAYLYKEYREGDDAFRYKMRDAHNEVIAADAKDPRPMVVDFYNRRDARNNALVYVKGASLLHMMRFLLGDALYDGVIRRFAEENKFGIAETQDMMRVVREATGENLDWFFEQWAFLAGHPRFKVSKKWDRDAGVLRLTVEQTQKAEGLVPVFRVPLDVEFTWDGGSRTQRIVVDRQSQEYFFALPAEPRMVIFDKGDWILKDLSFAKSSAELIYQLEHGDFMSRVRAAEALGAMGSDAGVVEALTAVMAAPGFYGLRREAALALGRVGTDAALESLVAGLELEDARVRLACAEALGGFHRDGRAEAALEKRVRGDDAYAVRAAAVTSIVGIRTDKAYPICLDALKQESDQGIVRNAALDGLATLRDPAALERIRKYCTPGNRRDHRHNAIAAYARLSRQLKNESDRERAADFLLPFLDDWYLRTREATIDALETIGVRTSIADLRRAASGDPVASVRSRASRAADRVAASLAATDDGVGTAAEVEALKRRINALEEDVRDARKQAAPDAAGEQ